MYTVDHFTEHIKSLSKQLLLSCVNSSSDAYTKPVIQCRDAKAGQD